MVVKPRTIMAKLTKLKIKRKISSSNLSWRDNLTRRLYNCLILRGTIFTHLL